MALLRKRKEFETEVAKLINRLSLESEFGNRPDWELARCAWDLLSGNNVAVNKEDYEKLIKSLPAGPRPVR